MKVVLAGAGAFGIKHLVREGREPNSSVTQVLACYRVVHNLEQQFESGS